MPHLKEEKTETEVAEYLKKHPQFFVQHQDLLMNMELPQQSGEMPFHERQVQALRERHDAQQARLDWMVDTARSNQDLAHELHHLAINLLALAGQKSPSDLAALVQSRFEIEEVAIFMASQQQDYPPQMDYSLLCQRVAHCGSVCDDRISTQLSAQVFPQSAAMGSCAFIPLAHQQKIYGVMVLGASERQRFQPSMGVLILDRLGQLLGAYLAVRNSD